MSAEVLKEWRWVHGVNLGTAEGGWVMSLSLVPADKVVPSNKLLSEAAAKNLTENAAADEARAVVGQLIKLGSMEMTRLSIQKNNIFEFSKFRLFKDDQSMFLALVDTAIESTELPNGVAVMRTVGQLGEQESKPIMLLDVLSSMDHIRSLSVHAACSIRHVDTDVDLMWSRWGINKLAGSRGNVFSNLSIHEAANFQSNLDGRPMDVDQKLWSLFKVGNVSPRLTFLQLYCDSPHNPQFPVGRAAVDHIGSWGGGGHWHHGPLPVQARYRPPLDNWTGVTTQQWRVVRLFPLTCVLNASDTDLGSEMLTDTLKDIFKTNHAIPWSLLKGEGENRPVLKDAKTYRELADTLLKHLTYFRYPCVFPRMVEMVKDKGRDVISCLVAGLTAAQLKFFPHVRYRTYKGTKRVNWKNDAYALLRPEGEPETAETRAIKLNELVAQELLDRALTEDGHLERYREWGMPWLPMVLSRIPPEKRLFDIRLWSVFSLKTICRDTVLYKLADDIPTTLPATRKPYRGKKDRKEEEEEEEEKEPADPGLDEATS
ncbi:uncharacterized protein LOC109197949 [Xyrichtys novacula]|uniref:Uncharacterized protein LOC109197949 n=1 Tax=Xyrichtys novacula TaxID=13765 RepID=A0AAV1FFZ4_XYRNO|nr:uncharacterized protein LOC109197949 [Xyrichtys novacula]